MKLSFTFVIFALELRSRQTWRFIAPISAVFPHREVLYGRNSYFVWYVTSIQLNCVGFLFQKTNVTYFSSILQILFFYWKICCFSRCYFLECRSNIPSVVLSKFLQRDSHSFGNVHLNINEGKFRSLKKSAMKMKIKLFETDRVYANDIE